jgi:plastocyanin
MGAINSGRARAVIVGLSLLGPGCGEEAKPRRLPDASAVGGEGGAGSGGSGGMDAAPDAARDAAPDLGRDAAPEASRDLAADRPMDAIASVEDAPVDSGGVDAHDGPVDRASIADAAVDAAVDASPPDLAADLSGDLAPDLPPDLSPDLAADSSPDTATAFVAIDPCSQSGNYTTTLQTINFRTGVDGYTPSCLKVPRHTTVTFAGSFGSHPLQPRGGGSAGNPITSTSAGSQAMFTFDSAGFFPYHCGIHSDMIGVIWVTE